MPVREGNTTSVVARDTETGSSSPLVVIGRAVSALIGVIVAALIGSAAEALIGRAVEALIGV
ncbi:hypothetical protein, partial [Sporomusa ovata]|uniref:hypothetical protein n=1 Tax=Sporomusa ovata TaxID=2378 RepID=UPI001B7FC006